MFWFLNKKKIKWHSISICQYKNRTKSTHICFMKSTFSIANVNRCGSLWMMWITTLLKHYMKKNLTLSQHCSYQHCKTHLTKCNVFATHIFKHPLGSVLTCVLNYQLNQKEWQIERKKQDKLPWLNQCIASEQKNKANHT